VSRHHLAVSEYFADDELDGVVEVLCQHLLAVGRIVRYQRDAPWPRWTTTSGCGMHKRPFEPRWWWSRAATGGTARSRRALTARLH
jgi:hypothetical protein